MIFENTWKNENRSFVIMSMQSQHFATEFRFIPLSLSVKIRMKGHSFYYASHKVTLMLRERTLTQQYPYYSLQNRKFKTNTLHWNVFKYFIGTYEQLKQLRNMFFSGKRLKLNNTLATHSDREAAKRSFTFPLFCLLNSLEKTEVVY